MEHMAKSSVLLISIIELKKRDQIVPPIRSKSSQKSLVMVVAQARVM